MHCSEKALKGDYACCQTAGPAMHVWNPHCGYSICIPGYGPGRDSWREQLHGFSPAAAVPCLDVCGMNLFIDSFNLNFKLKFHSAVYFYKMSTAVPEQYDPLVRTRVYPAYELTCTSNPPHPRTDQPAGCASFESNQMNEINMLYRAHTCVQLAAARSGWKLRS